MTPSFRRADEGDIEVLLPMMRQLHAAHDLPFPADASRRAALLLIQEPSAGCIWLIEADGTSVGYAAFTLGFSLEYGGWYGFIDELFVEVIWRSAGLGTAAVRHVASECSRLGMTALLLEADLRNPKATHLYRRLGFREHARRLMTLRVN